MPFIWGEHTATKNGVKKQPKNQNDFEIIIDKSVIYDYRIGHTILEDIIASSFATQLIPYKAKIKKIKIVETREMSPTEILVRGYIKYIPAEEQIKG